MAFRAKDGRAFGNRQKMTAYNERSSPKSEPKSEAQGETDAEASSERPASGHDYASQEDPEHDDHDISSMDIGDVVRSHGPASKIEISHDGDLHNVTSTHSGRRHSSTHPTSAAAHVHAGSAAGLSPEDASTEIANVDQASPGGNKRSQIPGYMG